VSKLMQQGLLRLGLALLLAFAFALLVSEVAFRLQEGEGYGRQPGRVELLVPKGTAELVAQGQLAPSLPQNMVFVQGDVLVVRNEDVVSHQLGPVWVPAGNSATLTLEQAGQYQMACSFQPSSYLGLDVRSRVTLAVRLQAMLAIGLPTGIMGWLYWLVVTPLKRPELLQGRIEKP
jgi:hypothetical protein